ncbi:hypothetical protein RI367_002320 [Sorochytrium milnesiophthora]
METRAPAAAAKKVKPKGILKMQRTAAAAPAQKRPLEEDNDGADGDIKRPRKNKNKNKKKKSKGGGKQPVPTPVAAEDSTAKHLEYLEQWVNDRTSWKFNKRSQIWLLKHLYNPAMVADSHFNMLLAYLDGLQGAVRTRIFEQAKAFAEREDTDDSGEGEELLFPGADRQALLSRVVEVMRVLG